MLFWVIIIIAAALRLVGLDLLQTNPDGAVTYYQVVNFLEHGRWPLAGMIASVGVHNFPLFTYLVAILGFFGRSWNQLIFLIVLINSLAVGGFYLLAKIHFGRLGAFVAALVLATGPAVVIYNHQIWATDLLLPFLVLVFFLVNKILLEGTSSRWPFFWLFFLLGLIFQLHASGWFLFLSVVVALLAFGPKINRRAGFFGFSLAMIAALPFVLYQFGGGSLCHDCQNLVNYLAVPKKSDLVGFFVPLILTNGLFLVYLRDNLSNAFKVDQNTVESLTNFPNPVFILQLVLGFIGSVWVFFSKKKYAHLLFILFLTTLFYLLGKIPSYPHYFIISLPFQCLTLGLAVKIFREHYPSSQTRIIMTAFLALFLASNIFATLDHYRFLGHEKTIGSPLGQNFSRYEKIRAKIADFQSPYSEAEIESWAYLLDAPANLQTEEFQQELRKRDPETVGKLLLLLQ